MNKKYLSIAYLLILTIGTILSLYMPKVESAAKAEETVVIPKEAIRLRILANSDQKEDQDVKRLIRDKVNQNITGWVKDLTSMEEAKKVIQSHLPEIQKTVEQTMVEQGLNQTVKVEFSKAKFPTKLYGQYLYPAGEYEAIVITLGKGEGANWWCVLFPPLCFMDFSNGTAVGMSPYKEEDTNEMPSAQRNGEKKEINNEDGAEDKPATREKIEQSDKIAKREEIEAEDKPVRSEKIAQPGNVSEQDQSENEQKAEQIYVSQDESPVVVKSFFKELIANIF